MVENGAIIEEGTPNELLRNPQHASTQRFLSSLLKEQLGMTRLGFVYPGGGAEHDYYRFAEEHGFQVFLAGSRTPGG